MESALILSIGAILGAFTRFLLQKFLVMTAPGFPFGTLTANCIGAFIIGLCAPIMTTMSPQLRLFLVTGFLGCLTTLSSFAYEVLSLVEQKRFVEAGLHWFGGAFLSLMLCGVGWVIGTKLLKA